MRTSGGRAAVGESSRASAASVVRQAAEAVRGAVESGRPLRIRLDPAELGSLRIEVARSADGVTVRLEAATAAARRLLTEQLPALRESLAAAGIAVDRVEVEPGRPGAEAGSDARPGDRDFGRGGHPSGGPFADRDRSAGGRFSAPPQPELPSPAPVRHAATVPLGGLDIQI